MWFVSLLITAAPVSPASSALSFDEALRQASAAEDVAGATRAEQLRRDGQYFHLFTSNPQLVLQPALRAEAGVARPEGQVSLTQSLNVAGLGAARAGVQRADVDLAAAERRLLTQDRRLSVAAAWVELWGAQEAARLIHEEELRVRELQERLERASASGMATRVELATTRAFAAELTALHLEWEGRRVEAGAALAELLGVTTLVEASGGLPQASEVDLAGLTPTTLPLVQLARSEVAGERARLEESAAQWGTQLQFSVLGGHEAPTQWIAGVGVGITLPLLEQGRRERTAHRAALAKLGAAQTLAERRAEVRLQVLQHELEHTAETLRVVAGELLPAAEEAVTLETRRFAQGEATLIELTLLRRQALNARIAAALAQARFAGARARAREMVQP